MFVDKAAFAFYLAAAIFSATEVAGNTNLALTLAPEAASASSFEAGTQACTTSNACAPDKAIDGYTYNTRWASLKPVGNNVEWFQIDFPYIVYIDKVILRWEEAYATEYEVIVFSPDEGDWITVYTEINGDGDVDTIDQLNTPCQSIRLIFLQRANMRFGYSLWEVEVYGPTTSNPPSLTTSPSMSAQPSPPPGSIPDYKNPLLPPAARAKDLLGRMNITEKIGQMTQVERKSLDNDQHIADYYLGSLLSGGGSYPNPNTAESWANMVDDYQTIAMSTPLAIPIMYGVDAVHGHSNVWNATIFPHNIGLGASCNATLAEEVGKITAKEVYATGIRWNFSPCLAVARDERWGRTYESFGEHPEIATVMTSYIDGLHGTYDGGPGLGAPDTVLATPKHWVGDGGTTGGDDQGFTELKEQDLLEIHGAPYNNESGAIFRFSKTNGTGAIMPSYSSVNFTTCGSPPDGSCISGELKMHGHGYLINDILRDSMGFEGFIVSDWQGIDQLPGDYSSDVETAIKAGIDMVMVPHDYQTFTSTLRDLYENNVVSATRIDEAVSRILTAKFHLGLFENPYADRTNINDVGSSSHRKVAREAVSQSLVLLKNEVGGDGSTPVPIDKLFISKIIVAGKNANNIGHQCGGWTIDWQGGSGDITPGTSILQAIEDEVSSTSIVVEFKGDRANGPLSGDLGIVVVGETPYAEGQGDDNDLALDNTDRQAIQNVCGAMTCIVILISGRPMIVNDELNQADAFIAAWLPGTEAAGITDVLFGHQDFTGKLPMTWPSDMSQIPINFGDANYDLLSPLFRYGYGLNYTTP